MAELDRSSIPARLSRRGGETAESARRNHTRLRLAAVLEQLAAAQLLFASAIVVVAVTGFVFKRPMTAWVLPLSAGLAVIALRPFTESWRSTTVIALATGLMHAVAGFIAAFLPDSSWDGLAYHQEAVLRLAKGWNPIFEDAIAYGRGAEIYLDHYPRGPWLTEAAVLLSTGHVEAGKLFNLTLGAAAGAMVVCALLRLTSLRLRTAVILAALVVLNPVFISQAATFYVDGTLGGLLTILVAALVMYVAAPRWPLLAIALLATGLLINLKFTGLVYAAALLAMTIPVLWRWRGWDVAWRMAAASAAAGVFATLVVGYAPYVRNTLEHGSPFYSVSPGPAHRPDLLQPQRPANLVGSNRFTRFFASNFSRSEALRPPDGTHLKLPFSIGPGERRGVYGADLESGGFGPLFGGLLILTALAAIALVAARPRREASLVVLLVAAGVLVSVFVHSETWWARFVPQAWLLPMLIAVAGLISPRRSAPWWLACGIVAVAAANVLVISANVGWRQIGYTRMTRNSLHEMAAVPGPLNVYAFPFSSLRERLSEGGVDFRMVDTPPTADHIRHVIPAPGNQAFWFESR